MTDVKAVLFISLLAVIQSESGILYPRNSIIREQLSLDGLWEFTVLDSFASGDVNNEDVELMPVPASYNDISTNATTRDHVGVVQYRRKFVVPQSWKSKRIWLRFGSVCYAARVYLNGQQALSHEIGHLPFVGEVSSLLKFDDYNDVRVLVNNTLTDVTVPQGSLETLASGRVKQDYTFDFFNYAGIDRSVVLYTTAQTYIDDITINTTISGSSAIVRYDIVVEGNDIFSRRISVLSKEGSVIQINTEQTFSGFFVIPDAILWWPYLMDDNPGYLYTLRVDLFDADINLLDRYEQPFGVRELSWDNTTFTINGKPLYLRGFGRHEDSDIRGKGLDLPLIIRDHNLIKWIGANAYRTSHYPYSEELMDLTDSLGIMIIDESPAVNTEGFKPGLLKNHKQSLTEMVQRDKNRPSVILWSVANEPRTQYNQSEDYYRQVVAHLKSLDTSRPVTLVSDVSPTDDYAAQFLDVLSFNKYFAWYEHDGDLDTIVPELLQLAETWHSRYNKTVLITEYGADTLEGLHFVPTYIWSEEYQTDLMSRHFQAFDQLREKGWFLGEMIWNFADFKTSQTYIRVGGNKKGIFTRQRQPKASAHLLRRRYWALAHALNDADVPADLDNYVIKDPTDFKDEL